MSLARIPRDVTYVQMARGMRFHAGTLTLLDLAPATVFLHRGDQDSIGHLSTGDFLDRWVDLSLPMRGVLSLLDAGARRTGDAELTLQRPRIVAAGLEYVAHLRHGLLPASSGGCVLFINPADAPVTPPSAWQDPAFTPA